LTMQFIDMQRIITPMIDALHFRRALHNMEIYNYELEIPLKPLEVKSGEPAQPDLSVVQDAWWATMDLMEAWKKDKKAPVKLTFEMRFMKGSGATLAPQGGNDWTCAIEVATIPGSKAYATEWLDGCQLITDAWFKAVERYDPEGKMRPPRFHWAKQWQNLSVTWKGERKTAIEYTQQYAYKFGDEDRIKEFLEIRRKTGVDPLNLFTNKFMRNLFALPDTLRGDKEVKPFVPPISVPLSKKKIVKTSPGSSPIVTDSPNAMITSPAAGTKSPGKRKAMSPATPVAETGLPTVSPSGDLNMGFDPLLKKQKSEEKEKEKET